MENTILMYLLKASVSIAVFYGLYILLLRNDTFFKLRRFYFLLAIAFSFIFPFIDIEISAQEAKQLPAYFLLGSEVVINGQETLQTEQVTGGYLSSTTLLLSIAISVSVLLLCKFAFQLYSLIGLRRRHDAEYNIEYSIIRIADNKGSSFSFFRWIFISENNNNQNSIKEIITHEKVHARQIHSIDVLLAEVLCILFWWNPFSWLIRREIKTNLEYLADRGVLDEGYNTCQYQYSLLQVSTNNAGIPIINNFNVSQLKKRITMMNKRKTSIFASLKYILAIPLVAGLLMTNCSPTGTKQESSDIEVKDNAPISELKEDTKKEEPVSENKVKPYVTVQRMPAYPGGEKNLKKFIQENLKYPVDAQKEGIQGRVTIRFTVVASGDIEDIEIIRGINPACDAEAMRVVKAMPKWEPGKLDDGTPVPVYFTLPIVFRLT